MMAHFWYYFGTTIFWGASWYFWYYNFNSFLSIAIFAQLCFMTTMLTFDQNTQKIGNFLSMTKVAMSYGYNMEDWSLYTAQLYCFQR